MTIFYVVDLKKLFKELWVKIVYSGLFVRVLIILACDLFFWDLGFVLGVNMWIAYDFNSRLFFSVGFLVTSSIILFSFWYIAEDVGIWKFVFFILFFLGFMFFLTFSGGVFTLLVGWEGVRIMSYLLISWWRGRGEASSSALIAIIYNRVRDFGLYLAFFCMLFVFYSRIFSTGLWGFLFFEGVSSFICLMFLIAVVAKSSQFFFHPWLPSAMEGPTPVSSLLHSSTIVVAGVFLIIRLSDLNTPFVDSLVTLVGGLTMLFGALSALGQSDVKKVVAYSTTSQLGLIMCSVGLGYPLLAFFHICIHAFFKAMIFLTSGFFIHYKRVNQDLRLLDKGGTKFSYLCFVVGSLSLRGAPFLTGYFSKDLILENMYSGVGNRFIVLILLVASVFTVAYSFRSILFMDVVSPFIPKLGDIERSGGFYFLLRLIFFSVVRGYLRIFFFKNFQESYLPTIVKLVPLTFILVSLIFLSMRIRLGSVILSYNPLVHRIWINLVYKAMHIIYVLEFYTIELFFSKLFSFFRRGFSFFSSSLSGSGRLRVYFSVRLIAVILILRISLLY